MRFAGSARSFCSGGSVPLKAESLKASSSPIELKVEDKDRSSQASEDLLWMFQQMLLIRCFEEKLLELSVKGLINGPVHTSVGQEAVAVGAAMAVRATDRLAGTHRAHHQYLAKALCACAGPGYDPLRDGLTDAMREHVRVLLSEVMGLADGCCGGRGGSMHLCNPEIGLAGTNAIVGGGVPIAVGLAWADACRGAEYVTLCFYGDGAVYQGVVHEAFNLAALWKAPVLFILENNLYAVATRSADACSAEPLCATAAAYGMPGFQADGMDPLAVRGAVAYILRERPAGLPCLLELLTYRHFHHAGIETKPKKSPGRRAIRSGPSGGGCELSVRLTPGPPNAFSARPPIALRPSQPPACSATAQGPWWSVRTFGPHR